MKKLWFRIAPVADVLLLIIALMVMIPIGIYQREQIYAEADARKAREAEDQQRLIKDFEMEMFHHHLIAQEQYGRHDCSYQQRHARFRAIDIGQP